MSKSANEEPIPVNPFAALFGETEAGVPPGVRILLSLGGIGSVEDISEAKGEGPSDGRWYDAANRLERDGITKGYNIKQAIDQAFGEEIFNAIRDQWKHASDGVDWIVRIQQRLGALASSKAHLEAENTDLRKNVGELLQYLSEAKADKDATTQRLENLVRLLDENAKLYKRGTVISLLRFLGGQDEMPELPTSELRVEKKARRFAELTDFLSGKAEISAGFIIAAYHSHEASLEALWSVYMAPDDTTQAVVSEQAAPEVVEVAAPEVEAEAGETVAEQTPTRSLEAPETPAASEPADEKGDYI